MRYRTCSCLALSLSLWTSAIPAATAPDEFSAPLQATSSAARSTPRDAGRIRTIKDELTQGPALQAGTAQAAVATAAARHTAGCRMIRFGSGFGWVATGTAQYPASENPVALRRSRQDARFKAFTDAAARLASCLSSLRLEARQRITEILEQNDAIRLALINLAFTETDKQEQALRILTRGSVAYSAEEAPNQRTVYVNLVTTPKTATRLTRPAANAIEAASLHEGLRQTQAEVGAGLIPPVGNRLIVVNATGELALVGYAINLIGAHPDPAAQTKLRADAEKIATNRATDALMGLAANDDSPWQNSLDEASKTDIQLFNSGYLDSEPSVLRFAQIRDLAMTEVKDDAGLEALREGRLPAAVAIKRFSGEDAVAITATYIPPMKKRESKPAPRPAVRTPVGGTPSTAVKSASSASNALAPPSPVNKPQPTPPPPPASTAPPIPPKVESPPTPTLPQSGPAADIKVEPASVPATPPAPSSPDKSNTGESKPAEAR